jgi:hypothetical protein
MKTDFLCKGELSKLNDFLHKVMEDCPDDFFNIGPRSSALRFSTGITPTSIKNHEISKMAGLGLENNAQYKSGHYKVQMFLLENDSNTVSIETPIWIHPNELSNFKKMFDSEDPLSGHIDVLRVEDGKVWIWDYKPKATLEKYASTQVYFYALMLSRRTGIPLEKFRCGYFNDSIAYAFKPTEECGAEILQQKKLV